MSCRNHEEHNWKQVNHFPFLKCKDCEQKGRIIIL